MSLQLVARTMGAHEVKANPRKLAQQKHGAHPNDASASPRNDSAPMPIVDRTPIAHGGALAASLDTTTVQYI